MRFECIWVLHFDVKSQLIEVGEEIQRAHICAKWSDAIGPVDGIELLDVVLDVLDCGKRWVRSDLPLEQQVDATSQSCQHGFNAIKCGDRSLQYWILYNLLRFDYFSLKIHG